jgi:hypothetical protein
MTNLALHILWILERISYEWETYGTDLQHAHGTTYRNASHNCLRASHPITMYSYGCRKIRYCYSTATNLSYFSHSYEMFSINKQYVS